MNEQEKINIYERAFALWGNNAQIMMLFEEMAELQKAVCKLTRKDQGPIEDVWDEIVDVEIMLEQLKYLTRARPEELECRKHEKLERLKVLISQAGA